MSAAFSMITGQLPSLVTLLQQSGYIVSLLGTTYVHKTIRFLAIKLLPTCTVTYPPQVLGCTLFIWWVAPLRTSVLSSLVTSMSSCSSTSI